MGESHAIVLLEPAPRTFRWNTQFAQRGCIPSFLGFGFDRLFQAGGPVGRAAGRVERTAQFAGTVTGENGLLWCTEKLAILRLGRARRFARRPTKDPRRAHSHKKHPLIGGVLTGKRREHLLTRRQQSKGGLVSHTRAD